MKHCGTKNLETERLYLRRFQNDDADAMFENWASDPEVTKYLTWPTHISREISTKVMSDWVKAYADDNYYQWGIVLKENGDKPIGCIAVVSQNEDISMVHIGYCIGKTWWNQGIVTEALKVIIEFFFSEVRANRIEARFDPRNPSSGMVMKKCGMKYEGTLSNADWNNQSICDASYYAILRADWFLQNFNLSKDEISDIIEDALVNYLRTVAKEGNRPFVLTDQLGFVRTKPTAWSNYIFYYNVENEDIEDSLSEIIEKVKNDEIPNEWVVGPKSRPKDLCLHLEQQGFQKRYEMAGMAIDLLHTDLTITIPENVSIIEVNTVPQMEIWADMISKGLWHGEVFESCLFTNLMKKPEYKFYLAYLNGSPVAASMLQLLHGVAAMDLICTLQEHWGKGIGNAMTKIPLLYARDHGYQIGVLQASMAGDHGYRKIGFEEYCRFYVYQL